MRESEIQQQIRAALGRGHGLVLWRNSTGIAERDGRTHRFGLCRGSADLIGILSPSGRFVALEVKRPNGKPTEEQTLFLELVRKQGGFAAVVDSVDSALAAVDRAKRGESR